MTGALGTASSTATAVITSDIVPTAALLTHAAITSPVIGAAAALSIASVVTENLASEHLTMVQFVTIFPGNNTIRHRADVYKLSNGP